MKFLISFFLLSTISHAQNINIYHGVTGATSIINNNITTGKEIKIIAKNKDKITLQIINPHPALYDYNFKVENIVEEEDKIEGISDLVSLLNTLLSQEPSSEAKKGRDAGGARVAAALSATTWQSRYLADLDNLKKEIIQARTIIKNSDNLESIPEAANKIYTRTGFQWAKNRLKMLSFFSNVDLEKDVNKWAIDYKSADDFDSSEPEQVLTMDIYNNYAQSLLKLSKDIKSAYADDISTTINYSVIAGDSTQVIYLSVKNKSETPKGREVGEKLVKIVIQPKFNRAVLEVVPIGTFFYTKDAIKYSIKDNVVTQELDENFKFRVGAVLNYNFATWGDLGQNSLGIGAGFAISENKLNTFYGSLLVSYKKWVRFGVGVGAINVPSHLNEGITVGSKLPSSIANLNDVIGYTKKPAIFFTFVIPGLNLSLVK